MAAPNYDGPRMLRVPPDPRYIVEGGSLLYDANRDHRHPYLYIVDNHPLDKRIGPFQGRTIVFVQDTTPEAIAAIRTFEMELKMPLGPDASVARLGVNSSSHICMTDQSNSRI